MQQTDPLSKRRIRSITTDIRNALQISKDKRIDVVGLLELLVNEEMLDYDLVIEEESEMPKEYAGVNVVDKTIYIREDTYNGACDGNGRDRFTIAHELGHIFLHPKGINLARNDKKGVIYCDPEWQANTFARELLCPLDGIDINDGVETIANKFGVSNSVASIQKKGR